MKENKTKNDLHLFFLTALHAVPVKLNSGHQFSNGLTLKRRKYFREHCVNTAVKICLNQNRNSLYLKVKYQEMWNTKHNRKYTKYWTLLFKAEFCHYSWLYIILFTFLEEFPWFIFSKNSLYILLLGRFVCNMYYLYFIVSLPFHCCVAQTTKFQRLPSLQSTYSFIFCYKVQYG